MVRRCLSMKVIGKNIAVRKIDETVKTASGLILSAEESQGFRYQKAEVVLPGTEVTEIPPGSIIYYDNSRAYSIVVDGDRLTIIQERDVVVVL